MKSASMGEIVRPAFHTGPEYVETDGPLVANLCADVAGFIPDPEQLLGLDLLFARNEVGKSACFEFAVICARQNLKTGLLKMAALGWLFITEEELIVWSAHEFNTAMEAHRDMVELIDGSPWLKKRVKTIYNSSADKSIELKSGARLVFKARTQSGGRGLSGKKVILDEGFALQAAHMGSLVPTLSAQPDPQLVYASSAGKANSTVLRGVRDRGRKGVGRLGYLEWCAPTGGCAQDACEHELAAVGCALDKPENWRAANPLLGRIRANGTGMTLEYLRSERETFAPIPMEFARERLGWWDDPGAAEVFGAGRWEACGGETPSCRLAVVAIAVSVDLSTAAVVGVGAVGARAFAQVLAHGPGWDWVVDEIPAGVRVVVDPKGPAAIVVPGLKAARLRVHEAKPAEVFDAFDAMLTAVKDGILLHDEDPVLTASANGAVPQNVGDRTRWARRNSTSDITAIEGATLGLWWLTRPAPEPAPPPPRPRLAPRSSARNDLITKGF